MKYFVSVLLIVIVSLAYAETYSTWDVLELDSCASAWLIKRFVDKDAKFKLFPKGEFINEGIPFDTPDAELRRKHGISTFESIIDKYKITDSAVLKIGEIIHEIEVNYWGSNRNKEAEDLSTAIDNIVANNKDPQKALENVFVEMDLLYKKLKRNNSLK